MAGLSGKSAWLAAGRQSAKGTAATLGATSYRNPFSGGNLEPVRETDRLEETDTVRDQSAAYVQTSGVEGEPELFVRPSSIGFYLAAALGGVTSTGTTHYTHEIVPANSLAYYTFWKNVGGPTGLFEKYTDCWVSSISIEAEAGNPLAATLGIQGLKAERLTTDPVSGGVPALASEQVYNFNNAAVSLGGSSTRLVRSFEFGLDNNVERQQTDDVVPYDLVPGQREITLGFDMLFQSTAEYEKFHYGGAGGTQVSPNIFTTDATFTFTIDANTEISFEFPSIAYEEFPIEPDPGGDPIVVSARAVAQKATGIDDLVIATVKNDVASYAT